MKSLACYLAFALSLGSSSVHAFRSTDFESFTDPEYVGYKLSKLLIIVVTDNLQISREIEKRLSEELGKRGIEVFSGLELFPPTRPTESYDLFSLLASREIESALVVEVGDRSSRTDFAGLTSHSTVTTSGNQAAMNTTTTPLHVQSSQAQFTATLLDVGADMAGTKTAWYGQITTQASGSLFVGAKGDAKGAARGIIRALAEDGHIVK